MRDWFGAVAAIWLLASTGSPVAQSKDLPRLIVDGQWFRQDTGARWTGIEATDFNLFNRYLQGEDVTPILRQRAELGFNLLRVWTDFDVCADGKCPGGQPIGRLVPAEHADFYTRLPQFLALCAQHDLYVELTAFTGRADADAARVTHWERLIDAVTPSANVLLELINEHNVHNKHLPYDKLRQPPAPILASHGSGGAGAEPRQPVWTHVTYHPGFGADWPGKVMHESAKVVAKKYNVPVLVNETTRFPDNATSLEHAYDVGRGCALLVAGCAFHSVTGKNSRLWQGRELALAREWARGARSVPLSCQTTAARVRQDPRFLLVYEAADSRAECRAEIRR